MQYTQHSITAWAEEDRPREKCLKRGITALTDAELLAIIIGSGVSGENHKRTAVSLAREIIDRFGGLAGLARANIRELRQIRGIGPAKAVAISAAFELSRRKDEAQALPVICLHDPRSIADYLRPRMADAKQEHFRVLFFNRANALIHEETLFSGGVHATLVDVRIVMQMALDYLASTLVVAHNHPSGSLKPSEADKTLTQKLEQAAKILDMRLSDHLIIARGKYFSFYEAGLLPSG